jgi:hypothetical protein
LNTILEINEAIRRHYAFGLMQECKVILPAILAKQTVQKVIDLARVGADVHSFYTLIQQIYGKRGK